MIDKCNITLTEDDFSLFSNSSEEFSDSNRQLLIEIYTVNSYDDKIAEKVKQQILHNQGIVNRIEMVIKDKENEVEYVEKQYPNIESESHNLHHEWKAKLDDIDMFKRLLL